MRLQCPNCDAEYEVDASAIPYDGRDVQCSNCGHGWFQAHPDFEAEFDVESALYDPPPPLPQEQRTVPAASNAVSEQFAAPEPSEPPKREIDPEVLRILREEVAFEAAKRAAEQQGKPADDIGAAARVVAEPARADAPQAPQKMPAAKMPAARIGDDFSLEAELDKTVMSPPSAAKGQDNAARYDAAPEFAAQGVSFDAANLQGDTQRSPSVIARRVARLKGVQPAAGASGSRAASVQAWPDDMPPKPAAPQPSPPDTSMFDDVRLANAVPQADSADRTMRQARARRAARRSGVYTSLLVSVCATLAYVFGPDIAAKAPQLALPLERYVSAVNGLRDQLDVRVPQLAGQGAAAAMQTIEFAGGLMQRLRDFIAAQGWI